MLALNVSVAIDP